MLLFILSWSFEIVSARHKCPKVPSPPGIMGVFSSSTLIPSGSVMAAARSSETLGCERGHPSDNFYKPQKERVSLFLPVITTVAPFFKSSSADANPIPAVAPVM